MMKLSAHPSVPFALALLLGCSVLASGCARVGRGAQQVATSVHEQTISFDHRVRDWFDAEDVNPEPDKPMPDVGYCYRTLGEVTCYDHPAYGAETRLVGKQVPRPMFEPYAVPVPQKKPEIVMVETVDTPPVTDVDGRVSAPVVVHAEELPPMEPHAHPVVTPANDGQPRPLIPVFEPQ